MTWWWNAQSRMPLPTEVRPQSRSHHWTWWTSPSTGGAPQPGYWQWRSRAMTARRWGPVVEVQVLPRDGRLVLGLVGRGVDRGRPAAHDLPVVVHANALGRAHQEGLVAIRAVPGQSGAPRLGRRPEPSQDLGVLETHPPLGDGRWAASGAARSWSQTVRR